MTFLTDIFGDLLRPLRVLLVAVLTAIPRDADQRALVAAIGRLLRPGGLFLVSDYLLAGDARNRERYARDAPRFGIHGAFEIDGGAWMRHHDRRWLDDLFGAFERLAFEAFDAVTMRGNAASGFRCVARKRVDAA